MRPLVSLAFIGFLVTSAVSVAAQENTAASGAFARAINREAVRLAATSDPTLSSVEVVQTRDTPTRSNWSRVRKLQPGTVVVVTVEGSEPKRWYVVRADDSELSVTDRYAQGPSLRASRVRGTVETIPMPTVTEITLRRRHGSGWGALGGAVAGTLVSAALARVSACGTCSGKISALFIMMWGAPVAGGVGGYYGFGRTIEEVIYRAP